MRGGAGGSGPVHRLTFDYRGGEISLVSDQVVNMITAQSQPLDEPTPAAGFSAIVRDAADHALYRVTAVGPIGYDAEVFSDDPSTSLHRVTVDDPQGTFVVLVPHLEGAANIEIIGPPLARDGRTGESQRLARFPLRSPQGGH